jgi:hypothetical protein
MTARYSPQAALEVLKDDEGSVTFGWVGRGVFYSRYAGSLSANLGREHVARLAQTLLGASSLQYFSDASALYQYDLAARSAFTRLVLENRRKFSRLVMLTWSTGVTPSAVAFAAAVGDSLTLLTDPTAFEKLLVAQAPLARQRIDARAWVTDSTPGVVRRRA